MICWYTQEWKEYQNNNSKILFFDNNFNVYFSVTMAYTDFKFCFHSLHTHSEGTASQIFNLGLGFHFMSKNGKHFPKIVSISFEVT